MENKIIYKVGDRVTSIYAKGSPNDTGVLIRKLKDNVWEVQLPSGEIVQSGESQFHFAVEGKPPMKKLTTKEEYLNKLLEGVGVMKKIQEMNLEENKMIDEFIASLIEEMKPEEQRKKEQEERDKEEAKKKEQSGHTKEEGESETQQPSKPTSSGKKAGKGSQAGKSPSPESSEDSEESEGSNTAMQKLMEMVEAMQAHKAKEKAAKWKEDEAKGVPTDIKIELEKMKAMKDAMKGAGLAGGVVEGEVEEPDAEIDVEIPAGDSTDKGGNGKMVDRIGEAEVWCPVCDTYHGVDHDELATKEDAIGF